MYKKKHSGHKKYKEVIRLRKRMGKIYGYIIPHHENYYDLKKIENKMPLRIRANLINNRFLCGDWTHPDNCSSFLGSFHLSVKLNYKEMEGLWTGYDEKSNEIYSGKWIWKKIDNLNKNKTQQIVNVMRDEVDNINESVINMQ